MPPRRRPGGGKAHESRRRLLSGPEKLRWLGLRVRARAPRLRGSYADLCVKTVARFSASQRNLNGLT